MFESSVNSEYGPIGITNIPDLTSANTQHDTLTGDLSNYQRQLNNLLSDRQAEEQRIRDCSNQLTSLGGYSSQAGQLGIGDINQINQLDRDLAALNTGRNAFSSAIMDQMYPGGFSQVNQQAEGIQNTLNDLRTQRKPSLTVSLHSSLASLAKRTHSVTRWAASQSQTKARLQTLSVTSRHSSEQRTASRLSLVSTLAKRLVNWASFFAMHKVCKQNVSASLHALRLHATAS